jgi:outer membrane protein TolC
MKRKQRRIRVPAWRGIGTIAGVALIVLGGPPESARAQGAAMPAVGPVALTLENAIDLALAESYSARGLQLDLLRSEQNAVAARGRFKTSADLDLDAPSYDQSFRDVRIPGEPSVFEQTKTLDWRAQLRVSQPLPTNGSLSLSGSMRQLQQDTFLEETDTDREDNRFFLSLRLGLTQPLFVPNDLKLGLERSELELERSQLRYTRTQLDVIYNVTDAFYDLYRARRERDIAQQTRDQQQSAYDVAHRKYEAGLIPEVESLQQEVDLATAENALLQADGTLLRAADSFRLTVGLNMNAEVVAVLGRTGLGEEIEDIGTVLAEYEIDEELALRHALRHRMEVRETSLNRRLAEISLAEADARRSVRGNLSAFYDISGISGDDLLGEDSPFDLAESSWNDLRERPDNKGVSFSLSVPLWDSGVNKAEVASARATLDQRGLDEEENRRRVIQQVNSAITRLREARRRVDVLRRSEAVAERGYDISRARFENGEITSQELALDRERYTGARQSTLEAFIQLQLASADLRRQTLYDFEAGRSLVGEDVAAGP